LKENSHPKLRRTHRSFAVNLDHISSIKKNRSGDGIIYLSENKSIKFSRNYKKELKD
jgi:DNA-binding LytR/AlgR family response regulator